MNSHKFKNKNYITEGKTIFGKLISVGGAYAPINRFLMFSKSWHLKSGWDLSACAKCYLGLYLFVSGLMRYCAEFLRYYVNRTMLCILFLRYSWHLFTKILFVNVTLGICENLYYMLSCHVIRILHGGKKHAKITS